MDSDKSGNRGCAGRVVDTVFSVVRTHRTALSAPYPWCDAMLVGLLTLLTLHLISTFFVVLESNVITPLHPICQHNNNNDRRVFLTVWRLTETARCIESFYKAMFETPGDYGF